MSVINQMLADLDARQAGAGERPALPSEVRVADGGARGGAWSRPLVWGGAALSLALAAGGAWMFFAAEGAGKAVAGSVEHAAPTSQVLAASPPGGAAGPVIEVAAVAPAATAVSAAAMPATDRRMSPSGYTATPASDVSDAVPRLRLSLSASAQEPGNERLPSRPPGDGRMDGAVRIDKQERALPPRERAEQQYQQALAVLGRGRQGDAADLLQRALRDDAGHAAARQVLVKLHLDAQALPAAAAVLEEGLRAVPGRSDWALLLSRLQVEQGDAAAAWRTLERFQGAAPPGAEYAGAMGAILYRLGRPAEAESRYAAALGLDAGNGRWWVGLAMAQEAQGKEREAREAFRRALAAGGLAADLRAYADSRLR